MVKPMRKMRSFYGYHTKDTPCVKVFVGMIPKTLVVCNASQNIKIFYERNMAQPCQGLSSDSRTTRRGLSPGAWGRSGFGRFGVW